MAYKHLSEADRTLIWHYHRLGYEHRRIAHEINRNHSTVSRELKRNRSVCSNWEEANSNAQAAYEERRSKACSHPSLTEAMKERFVSELSESRITPELFAGKLRKEAVPTVGKDSYYRFLYRERRDLITLLPRQGRKSCPGRRKQRKLPEPAVPKVNISKRPEDVALRKVLGHYEGDTMHGKKGGAVLAVIIERACRKIYLRKIKAPNGEEFRNAAQDIFSSILAQFKLSVTLDNGPEMALFYQIDPNMDFYFCNPYSSWEKGSVENRIQVVRLFIPKGTDIDALSDEFIQSVENKVNNRTVQLLNFHSPNEAFNMLAKLQLAA